MFDVLGFGICTLDYLAALPRFPREDERLTIDESDVQGGGLVATAMVAAERLGLRACYAGAVGDDLEGRRAHDELEAEGVDTRHVQVHAGTRTRHSFILVHPATMSRTILAHNKNAPVYARSDDLVRDVRRAKALFLDGSDPAAAMELAGAARAARIPVVMDADLERAQTVELSRSADIIIASHGYARWVSGEESPGAGARAIQRDTTARQVVVTAGKEGAWGVERDDPIHQSAFPVPVRDTTGAGDVFHGAYLVGVVERWSLRESMRFACGAAALKCRDLGGRRGIPARRDVETLLNRS